MSILTFPGFIWWIMAPQSAAEVAWLHFQRSICVQHFLANFFWVSLCRTVTYLIVLSIFSYWANQKAPSHPIARNKKNHRLHIFRPLSFNPDAPDPGRTTPGLVPHHRSTCPFRFTQGLTPSYRIAGRYGRLILLSTKALGCVMRSTSTPFFTHTLLPCSPPH